MAAKKTLKKDFVRKYPPKKKDPKKVASMNANRLVTVRLSMRHFVNGVTYGPGEVKVPFNLAQGMLHTEGHAAVVEEQFQGTKSAIIGARSKTGAVTVIPVPNETFDNEWTKPDAIVADAVRGSQYGQDTGTGNKF